MISLQDFDSCIRWIATLGCGLIAGVFFAFSTFVMKALAKLPAQEGIAAMQSINLYAVKSWFLPAFLGTALACLLVAILTFWQGSDQTSNWQLTGATLYFFGTFLVTVIFNVPMNDALAALSPVAPDAAARWAEYLSKWTLWNHVRTIAALAATVFFIMNRRSMS